MTTELDEMLDKYRVQSQITRDMRVQFMKITFEEMFEFNPKFSAQLGLVNLWNQNILMYIESLKEPEKAQAYEQLTKFLDEEDEKDKAAGVYYPDGTEE